MLDFLLANKKEPVVDMRVKGTLGCRDHQMLPLRILRGVRISNSKIATLNFRKLDFRLLRDLLG